LIHALGSRPAWNGNLTSRSVTPWLKSLRISVSGSMVRRSLATGKAEVAVA